MKNNNKKFIVCGTLLFSALSYANSEPVQHESTPGLIDVRSVVGDEHLQTSDNVPEPVSSAPRDDGALQNVTSHDTHSVKVTSDVIDVPVAQGDAELPDNGAMVEINVNTNVGVQAEQHVGSAVIVQEDEHQRIVPNNEHTESGALANDKVHQDQPQVADVQTEEPNPVAANESGELRVSSDAQHSEAAIVDTQNSVSTERDDLAQLPSEKATETEASGEVDEQAPEEIAPAPRILLSPFVLTREEASARLQLTDGVRTFDPETIADFAASTPFSAYMPRIALTPDDFENKRLDKPLKIELTWHNTRDPNWQPVESESFCNTQASGEFIATVTASFKKNNVVLTQSYLLPHTLGLKMCRMKPLILSVESDKNYSADFDPATGFSTSGKFRFPTTAFKNAQFDVLLNGDFPAHYRLRSSHQDKGVEVSGKFGDPTVKFTDKPEDVVTLELVDDEDNRIDIYAFRVKKWFSGGKQAFYPWKLNDQQVVTATDVCNQLTPHRYRVASRAEVTNATFKDKLLTGTSPENVYRRAIGEGLLGEWGFPTGYRKTEWTDGYYWLYEETGKGFHLATLLLSGELMSLRANSSAFVICSSSN